MQVVATAGHVDHGKSTLLRALTGMEPDRWAEERRRGMTIDLGFAWRVLPSGATLAFVDVPGHARFVTNMLAGLGPVPAVVLVVAADEGWMAQTQEHVDAIDALGVRHGLLVITKSDLADPQPALAQARARLAQTSLAAIPAVAVSATSGAGLADLVGALETLVAALPAGDPLAVPRLWVDRSFHIRGAGTVVTGTLPAGTLRPGEELALAPGGRLVRIRALQSLGAPVSVATGVARVAVNLRGVAAEEIRRGEALVRPDSWLAVSSADLRLDRQIAERTGSLMLHVGSAAVPVSLRPLGDRLVRVRLATPLPLRIGERVLLRDAGAHRIMAGADLLDPDPPQLTRRGSPAARAAALAETPAHLDVTDELRRRGVVRISRLRAYSGLTQIAVPELAHRSGDLLIARDRLAGWVRELTRAVLAYQRANPLQAGAPEEEARREAAIPPAALSAVLAATPSLRAQDGRLSVARVAPSLPPAVTDALATLTARLRERQFAAPEAGELAELGLDARALAAAVRLGRLVRVGEVYLLPEAPELAVAALRDLAQPFTVSDARRAWDTTRRVAVPLLEHLDAIGRTRRVDGSGRVLT